MTETSTITVQYDYTVKASKVLEFTDQTGFYFAAAGDDASLFNRGQVYVTSSTDDAYGATSNGSSFYSSSVIWNEAGAVFSVAATGANDAYGYYTGSWGPALRNDGTFTVSAAAGNAVGEMSWSPYTWFSNSGDFEVTAGGTAVGVFLYNGGDVTNTGVIHVHGDAGAIGVEISFYDSSLTNSGTIKADDHTDAIDSAAVQVNETFSAPPIVNSGLIKGDYAILESDNGSSSSIITNTGRMVGIVQLGGGDNIVHNDGSIRGDVLMDAGDDFFDGSGVVHGNIVGGLGADSLSGGTKADVIYGDELASSGQDGRDVLTGGAGADTLHGGGGSDAFVYGLLSDSKIQAPDLIWDLRNQDRIDLSAIDADTGQAGDQAFVVVAAFDNHAGEITLTYDGASDLTTIAMDVDGDGQADMAITARGDHSDFTHFVL